MRELGRKSGEARRRPDPERLPVGPRAYLRENVAPAEVWEARAQEIAEERIEALKQEHAIG